MQSKIVLDSYALLAFFQDESGADLVRKIILDAVKGNSDLSICTVNVGEVWYSIARRNSIEIADQYVDEIQSMPIEIVDADWNLTRQASIFKINGGISYADCYAAALAKCNEAELVTGDKEFKKLDKEIKIIWLK